MRCDFNCISTITADGKNTGSPFRENRCFQILLPHEALGETAAFAQIFGGTAAAEPLQHILCPFRLQDRVDIFPENIAQGDDTVAVQTAGNHRSVAKNAEMGLQTVAGKGVALNFGIAVGPFETLVRLDKDLIPDPGATGIGYPIAGDLLPQHLQRKVIFAVVRALVPKAEHHDGSVFGGACGKFRKGAEVTGMIFL